MFASRFWGLALYPTELHPFGWVDSNHRHPDYEVSQNCASDLELPIGFEPMTLALQERRSGQLS